MMTFKNSINDTENFSEKGSFFVLWRVVFSILAELYYNRNLRRFRAAQHNYYHTYKQVRVQFSRN
jgi:hypothetical protein